MEKFLRKVKFTLAPYECHTDEDLRKDNEERSKIREGYFHRWIEDIDTSKDIPYIKTVGLIEEIGTGKLYVTDYYNINFVQS